MKDFKKKFQINQLMIKQIGNWTISLRPHQVTLASLVLSLNRSCETFGGISREESADLSEVFRFIEQILSKTFSPDKINYLALMMVDSQVHYHVIPRYKNHISFEDEMYVDSDWPMPPDLSKTINISKETIEKLTLFLKDNS